MTTDFAAARRNMVESQVRTSDVTDPAIQAAMRKVPREALCQPASLALAYADVEVPCGGGRFLMRPREVAKLLQALRPRAGERALAIAAPYAAMVLEAMGLTVDRLEQGDLTKAAENAYDVAICEGAVASAPQAWIDALAVGGRLAMVERSGAAGKARLYLKEADGVASREVFDASPPYLPGFEPRPAFAF